MPSILDFLAAANDSINQAAKEQAHREALAAAYLNVPASHTAVKPLAARAQQMLDQAEKAKAPTHAQAMRGALTSARGAPALANSPALAKMASVAEGAAEAIGKEIDRHEKLTDAASAYLGIMDRADPAVRRLAQGMDGLLKKQTTGAEALKKAYADATRSGLIASATLAGTFASLRGFAAAGNAGVVRAMDQSLQLLTAKMGTALLPVTSEVISGISDLTDWFSSLDGGTKRLIAGGVIAVPTVLALATAARGLVPAVVAATAAIQKMKAAAAQNSVLGSAVGVAGAASPVALIASVVAYMGANPTPAENHDRRTTREEMEFAWKVQHGSHGMSAEQWNRLSDSERKQASAMEAQRLRGLRERGENNFFNTGNYGLFSGEAGAGYYAHQSNEDLDRAADIFERYSRMGPGEASQTKQEISWRKRVSSLNMQVSEASRESRPAYSGLAEARKTLQINTLAKGPYEQQLLKENREQLKVLQQLLAAELKRGQQEGFRLTSG